MTLPPLFHCVPLNFPLFDTESKDRLRENVLEEAGIQGQSHIHEY